MSDLKAFSQYLHESGRKARTVRAYVSDVVRYMAWCEREYGLAFSKTMLNRSDLHDYQVACRKNDRTKAATWNRYMASLSAFAAWMGIQIGDALSRAESQKLAPKSLSKPEYKRFRLAVLDAIRTSKSDTARRQALRNAVVVTLLADAGLREGEVVHLRVEDVLLGERKGRVLICDAKGNKDRIVPIDKDSVDMVKAWLAVRPALDSTDALLVGKFGESLQERGIQKLVAGIAKAARIGHVTPHMLRHTAAYRWRENGADLVQIATLLGHSSIEVTRRYTLPHWEDLEGIVDVP